MFLEVNRCDYKIFPIRKFWENERPSSSEDETEPEGSHHSTSEAQTNCSTELIMDNIEAVKDLNLSTNELKSEIRKLEYKISKLETENKIVENKRNQLENKLKSSEERYDALTNSKFDFL